MCQVMRISKLNIFGLSFFQIESAHVESSKSVREVLSSGVSLAFGNAGIRFYLNDCDTAFINTNLAQIKK
jgi:hypothetical protein